MPVLGIDQGQCRKNCQKLVTGPLKLKNFPKNVKIDGGNNKIKKKIKIKMACKGYGKKPSDGHSQQCGTEKEVDPQVLPSAGEGRFVVENKNEFSPVVGCLQTVIYFFLPFTEP